MQWKNNITLQVECFVALQIELLGFPVNDVRCMPVSIQDDGLNKGSIANITMTKRDDLISQRQSLLMITLVFMRAVTIQDDI